MLSAVRFVRHHNTTLGRVRATVVQGASRTAVRLDRMECLLCAVRCVCMLWTVCFVRHHNTTLSRVRAVKATVMQDASSTAVRLDSRE